MAPPTTAAAPLDLDSSPHEQGLEDSLERVRTTLRRHDTERALVERADGEKAARLVDRQQRAQLAHLLEAQHPGVVAFVLENIKPEERERVWECVPEARKGATLLETSTPVLRTLMADRPPEELAPVLAHLDPDDIAELLADAPPDTRAAVLARLDRDEASAVRSVLSFPEGSVGALMDLDFVALRPDTTVEAALRLLRRHRRPGPGVQAGARTTDASLYPLPVTGRDGSLKGLLPLSALLFAEPDTEAQALMLTEPVVFHAHDPVRAAVDAFGRYDLLAAPVINLHRQVVGLLTVDVVLDASQEQAGTDSLRQAGLSADEDLFGPLWDSARNRWPWLALNLITAFIASRVIDGFSSTIAQLVSLAALMPIVASIGGNTGNQTVALVIRGLALGTLTVGSKAGTLWRLFFKEMGIATVNGLFWGAVLWAVSWALYRSPALSSVMGLAVLGNLWVAAGVGVLMPLLLHRFGRDPVMGSSVLLTAATDSMGFFLFLGLARLILL